MHHLEWKGAHYEMGVERGRFFQKTESHFLCIWTNFSSDMETAANRY